MSSGVAAPALPAVEDLLDALVEDVLARLEAAAAAIGVPAAHIHDHPVGPIPEDRLPAIEVAAAEEIEEFTVNGTPLSPRTQAQVLVLVKTGTAKGWRRKAFALRHRVRVALLTDPGLLHRWGAPVRAEGKPAFDGTGALVAGAVILTLTWEYGTAYPPPLPDTEFGTAAL